LRKLRFTFYIIKLKLYCNGRRNHDRIHTLKHQGLRSADNCILYQDILVMLHSCNRTSIKAIPAGTDSWQLIFENNVKTCVKLQGRGDSL